MKTLFEYRVEITDGKGIIKDCGGYTVSQVDVYAESEKELVTKGTKFGTFVIIKKEKDKHGFNQCLNVASISVQVADNIWGSRVSYLLYSEKKTRASTIKKSIENEINKKVGFFMAGIDLSCVKDK